MLRIREDRDQVLGGLDVVGGFDWAFWVWQFLNLGSLVSSWILKFRAEMGCIRGGGSELLMPVGLALSG